MALPQPDEMMIAPTALHEGLPLPTKAQVAYWRELCQAVATKSVDGLRDPEWPVVLCPSRPTTRAMEERGLLVRRSGSWHLRRHWENTLQVLQSVAVPTPRLTVAERPAPNLPTFAELEAWEGVCQFLDAQPKARARLPFPELEVTPDRLAAMRRHKLVRHAKGCYWALSRQWKTLLRGLWHGVVKAYGEEHPEAKPALAPFVVAAGIDTLYLNRIDEAGLTPRLRKLLDEWQSQAKEDGDEVETLWQYDGAPLKMYRAGVSAGQGGGVSWAYILRNPSIMVLIRRAPLGGIIASVRLGSECLWRLTPARCLDELNRLFRQLWGRTEHGRWQVSQVHLAVDVANTSIEEEQLSRYVSRSRKRTRHLPSAAELTTPLLDDDYDPVIDGYLTIALDPWVEDAPASWGDLYGLLGDDEPEMVPVEDRAIILNEWGKQLSGVTWSPGSAISFQQYDKTLQQRLSGKAHMRPIWEAAGWDGAATVIRHEARLRREALGSLALVLGKENIHCFDDPLDLLEHLQESWGYIVGTPPSEENCPDEESPAWLRLVMLNPEDSNRSRWQTDPTWRVVQSAQFADAPQNARRVIRQKRRDLDVARRDRAIYGLLVSRVALKHPEGGQWDISRAIAELAPSLTNEAQRATKDFGELVRDRRRTWGLPLPSSERQLPAIPTEDPEQPDPAFLDQEPEDPALKPWWQLEMAERRMREALIALEGGQNEQLSDRELRQRENAYEREAAAYGAALAVACHD